MSMILLRKENIVKISSKGLRISKEPFDRTQIFLGFSKVDKNVSTAIAYQSLLLGKHDKQMKNYLFSQLQ